MASGVKRYQSSQRRAMPPGHTSEVGSDRSTEEEASKRLEGVEARADARKSRRGGDGHWAKAVQHGRRWPVPG